MIYVLAFLAGVVTFSVVFIAGAAVVDWRWNMAYRREQMNRIREKYNDQDWR